MVPPTDLRRSRLSASPKPSARASPPSTGQALWRTPIAHLSPWDLNWPVTCEDCPEPAQEPPKPPCPDPEICGRAGSFIDCQNQALEEELPLVGTPFSLHYRSDRVSGDSTARTIHLNVTGPSISPFLSYTFQSIQVAGQSHVIDLPTLPNQAFTFTWDGRDAYGRVVQGTVRATVNLVYAYQPCYCVEWGSTTFGIPVCKQHHCECLDETPCTRQCAWGSPPASPGPSTSPPSRLRRRAWPGGASMSTIRTIRSRECSSGETAHARRPVHAGRRTVLQMVAAEAPRAGRRRASDRRARLRSGEGGCRARCACTSSSGTERASAWIARDDHGSGRRACVQGFCTGTRSATAGSPTTPASPLSTSPWRPWLCLHRRRAEQQGEEGGPRSIIWTFAGGGASVDNRIPATEADLLGIASVAVGPDGSVYVLAGNRLRKIDPGGFIDTIAGDGSCPNEAFTGEGGPAADARFCASSYGKVAVGRDGRVYLVTEGAIAVYRISLGGSVERVAGTGTPGDSGDGGPATAAQLQAPADIALGPDGTLYVADAGACRVRAVFAGVIRTVAGTGTCDGGDLGGPPEATSLRTPLGIGLSPGGALLIAERDADRVLARRSGSPGFTDAGTLLLPSSDATELFVFDGRGRHLETLDGLTRAPRLQFAYNLEGRLTAVSDADGNVTSIERDGSGRPTAILAPRGQRTSLEVNGDGWLSAVTNPAGETTVLGHSPGGLLGTVTNPLGASHHFSYDQVGALVRDQNPVGRFTALSREDRPASSKVAVSTALGRMSTHTTNRGYWGRRYLNDAPDGTRIKQELYSSGQRRLDYPDGTVLVTVDAPNPRYGMRSPYRAQILERVPSGLTLGITTSQSVTLAQPDDPLSFSLMELVTVDGRTATRTYDAVAGTFTAVTPAGRPRSGRSTKRAHPRGAAPGGPANRTRV